MARQRPYAPCPAPSIWDVAPDMWCGAGGGEDVEGPALLAPPAPPRPVPQPPPLSPHPTPPVLSPPSPRQQPGPIGVGSDVEQLHGGWAGGMGGQGWRGGGQAGQVVGGGRCPEGVDGVGCWQGEKWQWHRFLKVVVPWSTCQWWNRIHSSSAPDPGGRRPKVLLPMVELDVPGGPGAPWLLLSNCPPVK